MQVTTDDSSATSPVAHRAPRHRWRFALVLAMVVALCGGGIGLYLNERNTREQTRELAIPTAQDWIELDITAQDVDPAAQQLTLYVTPVPHGRLAAGADGQAFSRPVEITVTGTPRTTIRAAEGETAAPQLVHVGMYDGTITDYPFDRYRMEAGFTATSGATPYRSAWSSPTPIRSSSCARRSRPEPPAPWPWTRRSPAPAAPSSSPGS